MYRYVKGMFEIRVAHSQMRNGIVIRCLQGPEAPGGSDRTVAE